MKSDKLKWDQKYRSEEIPLEPSQVVRKFYSFAIPQSSALDIAAGNGRNAVFLAQKGFQVDAVDISHVGLNKIQSTSNKIHPIEADLDSYQLKTNYYDLIININYLQRDLFSQIIGALRKNGIIIFQTFLENKDRVNSQLMQKSHYLKTNELLHAFISLQVVYYEESYYKNRVGEIRDIASLVARKTD